MPAFDVFGLSLSDKKVMDSYEQFRGCKGYRCMKMSKVCWRQTRFLTLKRADLKIFYFWASARTPSGFCRHNHCNHSINATKACMSLIIQNAEGPDGSPGRTLRRGSFLAITKAALNAVMHSGWPSPGSARVAGINAEDSSP